MAEGFTTVMDVLYQKHPVSCPPGSVSLFISDLLPKFEDVEINGRHILYTARSIQGGAGPGGCDTCHLQDVLSRYGAHNAVATLLTSWLTPLFHAHWFIGSI